MLSLGAAKLKKDTNWLEWIVLPGALIGMLIFLAAAIRLTLNLCTAKLPQDSTLMVFAVIVIIEGVYGTLFLSKAMPPAILRGLELVFIIQVSKYLTLRALPGVDVTAQALLSVRNLLDLTFAVPVGFMLLLWLLAVGFTSNLVWMRPTYEDMRVPSLSGTYSTLVDQPFEVKQRQVSAYRQIGRRFLRLTFLLLGCWIVLTKMVHEPQDLHKTAYHYALLGGGFFVFGLLLVSLSYLYETRKLWEQEGATVSAGLEIAWVRNTALVVLLLIIVGFILPANISPLDSSMLVGLFDWLFGWVKDIDISPAVMSPDTPSTSNTTKTSRSPSFAYQDMDFLNLLGWGLFFLGAILWSILPQIIARVGVILLILGIVLWAIYKDTQRAPKILRLPMLFVQWIGKYFLLLLKFLRSLVFASYNRVRRLGKTVGRKLEQEVLVSYSQETPGKDQNLLGMHGWIRHFFSWLLVKGKALGRERWPSETANEYVMKLSDEFTDLEQDLTTIGKLYTEVRYSNYQPDQKLEEQGRTSCQRVRRKLEPVD